jgi:phosphohistidine phosphatase
MKRLYLVRHAKSSWKLAGQISDFDRPLNPRGLRDAPFMAEVLRKKGAIPDLMIASPSMRTQATAQAFAKAFQKPASSIQLELGIYEAWPEHIFEIIEKVPSKYQSLMLFGHNPAFTDLVQQFAPKQNIENLPTTGICCFDFEIEFWYEIDATKAQFQWFEYPKLYFPKNT